MDTLFIHEHALKHGLTDEEIRHAWRNAFVTGIRKRNDDALWLKMLKKEPYIWGMTDVLTGYRVRRGSISSNKLELIRYHWILYRKIEHLSAFRSLFHIGYWCVVKVLGIK